MSGQDELDFLRNGWPVRQMPQLLSKLASDSAPRRFALCAVEMAGDRLRDAEIVGWGLEFTYVDDESEDEKTEVLVDLVGGGIARFKTADGVRRLFSQPDDVQVVWC